MSRHLQFNRNRHPVRVDVCQSLVRARARDYTVEIARDWKDFAPAWQALAEYACATPFQHCTWLSDWYRAFTVDHHVAQPLLVSIKDAASDSIAMLLPLALIRQRGLRTITFADLDVTDCNAPLLGPAAPVDAVQAEAAIGAMMTALPSADRISFDKMPDAIGARMNPLALASDIAFSRYDYHTVRTPKGWPSYLAGLDRHYRKELNRSQRLLDACGQSRFSIAATPAEAARLLQTIDELQRQRLRERGARHVFDSPPHRHFYDLILRRSRSDDPSGTLVSAITIDDELVAGLVMIAHHPKVVFLRIANAGGKLAQVGLGRLIFARTLEALADRGFTQFDFSIGEGEHKRRFGTMPAPLLKLERHLTMRSEFVRGLAAIKSSFRRP